MPLTHITDTKADWFLGALYDLSSNPNIFVVVFSTKRNTGL